MKKEAAKQGLTVEIKTFSDYVTPDQALAQKDIDLNSFQHEPFLLAFNKKNGTKLVSIGKTYLAPLKLYSTKIKDIKDIPDGAKIAIPNDPSNGGRAILMLSKLGLLKVNPDVKATELTVNDITETRNTCRSWNWKLPSCPGAWMTPRPPSSTPAMPTAPNWLRNWPLPRKTTPAPM